MTTQTAGNRDPIAVVAIASFIGTTIEWYDFFLYGTAAALVFNHLFFPTFDPLDGHARLLWHLRGGICRAPDWRRRHRPLRRPARAQVDARADAAHHGHRDVAHRAAAHLSTARPLGAVALVTLRIAQGFGVGGEWGGAVLMAVEHAPAAPRGYYGSWPQIGVPAGLLLSTGVFAIFSRLPDEQFLSWGWRVPFLLSGFLVVVGLLIRLRIMETPAFARMKSGPREAHQPILEVLRHSTASAPRHGRAVRRERRFLHLQRLHPRLRNAARPTSIGRRVLSGILLGAALELFAIPVYGALSDRVGRRPVYLFGAIMTAVLAFPLIWLIETRSTPLVWLGLVVPVVAVPTVHLVGAVIEAITQS